MEDLRLPIIRQEDMPKDRYLSMEEYLKFVMFNLKYTVDMKAVRKIKRKMLIGKPFAL